MPSSHRSSPDNPPKIQELAQAIRETVEAAHDDLATTDDAHLFGDNEFKIRAIAHEIATNAFEQYLAQKNGVTFHEPKTTDAQRAFRRECDFPVASPGD